MLTNYQNLTAQLLQNPAAPSSLYPTANLTNYINIARGQIAGEGQCIRRIGTVSSVVAQRNYNFSSISFSDTSVQGAIDMNWLMYGVGTGQKWVNNKPWAWFSLYGLNNPAPTNGPPIQWAQYGQGSAGTGSITGVGTGSMSSGNFYVDPPPDLVYTLYCECVCYPIALALDSDAEALPYLWTDAVPFYAAWLALMASQTSTRLDQAQRLYQLFEQFMTRARRAANAPSNTFNYEQSGDPTMQGKLGIRGASAGANGGGQ